MSTYTYSDNTTFTITHARHIGAKVATDLKRMQRFYGSPNDTRIEKFELEIVMLLKAGYLDHVSYGFRRDDNWVEPTLRYTARQLVSEAASDDPGRVQPGADTTGASFHSYLVYNASWKKLSGVEQKRFKATLPLQRKGAAEPGVAGYFESDLTYSSGGRAVDRQSLRS